MKKRSLVLKDIPLRTEKNETGDAVLVGVIPYNSQGESLSGMYKEVITDSAFTQDLKDKARVVALKNHNDDYPLGTTERNTLTLTSTKEGLECRCTLPKTTYADDLVALVERGDACGMSFGFISRKEEVQNGVVYLLDVQLLEVSFGVVFPFYKEAAAGIDMRSALEALIEKGGSKVGEELIQALKSLVSIVQGIIDKAAGGAENPGQPPASDKKDGEQQEQNTEKADPEKEDEKKEAERKAQIEQQKKRTLLALELMDI